MRHSFAYFAIIATILTAVSSTHAMLSEKEQEKLDLKFLIKTYKDSQKKQKKILAKFEKLLSKYQSEQK